MVAMETFAISTESLFYVTVTIETTVTSQDAFYMSLAQLTAFVAT